MRGWRALLLTCTILLTGCLGGGGGDAPVEAAGAEETQGADGSGVEGAGEATAAGAESPTAAPVIVPITFEGSLPPFAEPCASTPVASRCVTATPGRFDNRYDIPETGNLTAARIQLEWSPASPGTESMGVALYGYTDEEYAWFGSAYGTSPVVLELPEPVELREGWTNLLQVYVGRSGVAALGAGAWFAANPAEQPFTLAGELILSAPANP